MTDADARPDTAALLKRAIDLVEAARPMPLSASVVISRDEVLEVLQAAMEQLPEELVAARRLLREGDEVRAQAQADGEAIVRDASARAEQLVQRTEVVRAAEDRARRIVAQAESEGRALHREVEDFCDQRLAQFEVAVDRIRSAVEQGRARLGVVPQKRPEPEPTAEIDGPGGPFDQDTA